MMFRSKWDLLTFLIITVTAFGIPSIADDQTPRFSQLEALSGELNILTADNFSTGISQRRYFIRVEQSGGDTHLVPLSFASIPPDNTLRSGDQITVGGQLIENTFAVHTLEGEVKEIFSESISRADGGVRTLPLKNDIRRAVVLIVDMADADNEYRSPNDIIPMMYTGTQNVNDLYKASSFGQLSFNPNTDGNGAQDVFGPFKISNSATENCSIGNQSVIDEWAKNADDAARADGIDLSIYQHRVYILPTEVQCGWDGMGTERCLQQENGNQYDCRAWVVASPFESNEGRFIAHEIGHNLEWYHSSYLTGNPADPISEYGDHSGIMGQPLWSQANAPHRDQLGWFDELPGSVVTTSCSGDYELKPLENVPVINAPRPHVIKIPIANSGEFFYLSYRKKITGYPANDPYADKINIHRHNGVRGNTFHLTNLSQNGVFTDTDSGIKVTATSVGSSVAIAKVRVEVPNDAPKAIFTHALTDNHLSVRFTDASTDDRDDIVSYQWDIDGKTFSGRNPGYTFPSSGDYPVTLTVTDGCGITGAQTQTVGVVANTPPTATFSSNAVHLAVQFTDSSEDSDGTIASYQWDFGDSTSSQEKSPSHTYAASGTYTVTLTVTDDDGATNNASDSIEVVANQPPVANFNSSATGLAVQFTDASEDSDGDVVSYQWKFLDDGSVSDQAAPGHTYAGPGTYKVQLTVTDDDNATDTEIKDITVNVANVNVAPTADFTVRAEGLSVTFTDTSSDSDGSITSYQWDFGDTASSTEASPSHTYTAAGTYAVNLIVTDNLGTTGNVTKNITVDVNNVPPVAAFTFTTEDLTVQFSNTSTDNDGDIETYLWEFGDGSTSSENSPNHTYAAGGTYTTTLIITDNDGASHSATEEITVDQIGTEALVTPPAGGGGGGGGCFIYSLQLKK